MTGLRDTDPEVARAPAEINIFDCVYFFTESQVFFCTENRVCDVEIFCRGFIGLKSVKTLCKDWDVTGHVFFLFIKL